MPGDDGGHTGDHYHVWIARRSQNGFGPVYVFGIQNRNAGVEGERADYVFGTKQAATAWAAARWPEKRERMVRKCDLGDLCPSRR